MASCAKGSDPTGQQTAAHLDSLCAALPAGLFCAANHFFHPRQILRQALPPWMGPALTRRCRSQRRTLRLRRYFIQRRARLLVGQQFQLQIVQRLAARPQQFHAVLPQLFGERLNLQMC